MQTQIVCIAMKISLLMQDQLKLAVSLSSTWLHISHEQDDNSLNFSSKTWLELPPLTQLKLLTLLTLLTFNSLLMQAQQKLTVSLSSTRFEISHMIEFIEGHFINMHWNLSSSFKFFLFREDKRRNKLGRGILILLDNNIWSQHFIPKVK